MSMKLVFLGTGTSAGVPYIGCSCEVCKSMDPHDKRLRCSGMVEVDGVRVLIDCGPDFREQMLRLDDFRSIDGVVITHEHYDHVGGLDDLRPFCKLRNIPVYAESYTSTRLKQRIPYCFVEHPYPGVPSISLCDIEDGVPFNVTNSVGKSIEIIPFRVMHGKLPIMAYRIGKMAWITDMTIIPESSYSYLEGLDYLVINALRITPHPTHQSLSEALQQAELIKAKDTYLIHACHQIGLHADVEAGLPPHVHLAYDGLTLEF